MIVKYCDGGDDKSVYICVFMIGLLHNNLCKTENKIIYLRYNCDPAMNNHNLCCIKSVVLIPKIQS